MKLNINKPTGQSAPKPENANESTTAVAKPKFNLGHDRNLNQGLPQNMPMQNADSTPAQSGMQSTECTREGSTSAGTATDDSERRDAIRALLASGKPNPDRVTVVDKWTHEPKEVRLPREDEQPLMRELKKPDCNGATTSSHASMKTQIAALLQNPSTKNLQNSSGENQLQKSQLHLNCGEHSESAKQAEAPLTKETVLQKLDQVKLQTTLQTSNGHDPAPQTATVKPALNLGKGQTKSQKSNANSRGLLWGTGLTKSLLQKTEKQVEKQADAFVASEIEQINMPSAEEFNIGELPDQLVGDIELDQYQTAAVKGLRNQKYGVLIGAAGTGKTTALKFLLKEIEDSVQLISENDLSTNKENNPAAKMLPAFAFCSFTGKAVQQMKRALPKKYHPLANTIHATLGYAPVVEPYYDEENDEWKERKVFRPTYNSTNKLPYKIIIVDETGTLALNLWHELLAACTDDCRIFFIGDLNQLPPVQGHSVLGFAMLKWPTFALEQLHRQAEGDPIAENAHRILQAKKPLTDHETKRFIVRKMQDGSAAARKEILQIVQHLHKQNQFNPMLDALIVPQNIGPIGQVELNNVLVNYFNPARKDETGAIVNPRVIITAGYAHVTFAVGDKVMLLANDTQKRLTNGMVGVVTKIVLNGQFKGEAAVADFDVDFAEIDLSNLEKQIGEVDLADDEDESERASSHIMYVKFQNVDEELAFETAGAFKKVALAYAMTCHKAQGSEYRNVIAVAHASNIKMLCREWLYTAITRAKERVFLLTNHRGLTHAVNCQRIKGNTIAEKAEKFLALQKGEKGESPAKLPEPASITDLKPTFN